MKYISVNEKMKSKAIRSKELYIIRDLQKQVYSGNLHSESISIYKIDNFNDINNAPDWSSSCF